MTRPNAAPRKFSLYLNDCLPEAPYTKVKFNVYSLMGCPLVPYDTRYKLVRVVNGQRYTLAIGRAQSTFGPLNLASIRFRGAVMGVDEIHIVR